MSQCVCFCAIAIISAVFLGSCLVSGILYSRPNRCSMTYMFNWPQFIRVPVKMAPKYPDYGLYYYDEGGSDTVSLSMPAKLTGNPVLFIHGNAGSYKQVRSLASISLMKSRYGSPKHEFNYFSVDLNEELSGLYGKYLYRQTEFVELCMGTILNLYNGGDVSVVLVGHSMGGLIARSIYKFPSHLSTIRLIITLATPHSCMPVMFDSRVASYIDEVNGYWVKHANTSLKHIVAISIGGGSNDRLVPSKCITWPITLTNNVIDEIPVDIETDLYAGVSLLEVLSTAIDGVWLSVDHLCIAWCKQLVTVIVRIIFDSHNKTKDETVMVSMYHLRHKWGGNSIDWGTIDNNINFGNSAIIKQMSPGSQIIHTVTSHVELHRIKVTQHLVGHELVVLTNQKKHPLALLCGDTLTRGENCWPIIADHRLPSASVMRMAILPAQINESINIVVYQNRAPLPNIILHILDQRENIKQAHTRRVNIGLLSIFGHKVDLNGRDFFADIELVNYCTQLYIFTISLVSHNCTLETQEQIATVHFEILGSKEQSSFRSFSSPYNSSDDLDIGYEYLPVGMCHAPVVHVYMHPKCSYSLLIRPNVQLSVWRILLLGTTTIIFTVLYSLLALIVYADILWAYGKESLPWQGCFYLWVVCCTAICLFQVDPLFDISCVLVGSCLTILFVLVVNVLCSIVRAIRYLSGLQRGIVIVKSLLAHVRWPSFMMAEEVRYKDETTMFTTYAVRFIFTLVLSVFINGTSIMLFILVVHLAKLTDPDLDRVDLVKTVPVALHIVTIVFGAPGGIVGFKQLISHGHVILEQDPSRYCAALLTFLVAVKIPTQLFKYKYLVGIVGCILVMCYSPVLANVNIPLCGLLGVHINHLFHINKSISSNSLKNK